MSTPSHIALKKPIDQHGQDPIRPFDNHEFDLVQRAQTGCSDAFGQLVQRYQMDVRWFLCRQIHDSSAVDDLAQEVFLGAMQRISAFQFKSSLRGWLIAIAQKKAIDYLRAKARRGKHDAQQINELLAQQALERTTDSLVVGTDHRELMSVLADCMRQLNGSSQALVRGFYFDNQTAEELASSQNKKPGSVRMALLRIRRSLAKCIKRKTQRGFES